MSAARFRPPNLTEQQILDRAEVRLLGPEEDGRSRYAGLMSAHHYLKSDTLVGEQLRYVAQVEGQWVALLSWSAAAQHLKDREQWIGWNTQQRRRRLALLANNARFLILPGLVYEMAAASGFDMRGFVAGGLVPSVHHDTVRAAIYFAIWLALAYFQYGSPDHGSPRVCVSLQALLLEIDHWSYPKKLIVAPRELLANKKQALPQGAY